MILSIWFQIGLLILINILVFPFKFELKYFIIPVIIWTALILSTIFATIRQDKKYQRAEQEYWEFIETNEDNNYEQYKELEQRRIEYSIIRLNLIHLIVFQSFLVLVFQIAGKRKYNKKKVYRLTTIFFAFTSVVCIILEFLISIVPTGRII